MILFLLLTPVALEACVATIPTETVHPTTRAAEMEETTTVAATSMATSMTTTVASGGGGGACPCTSYPPETPQAYAEERILPISPNVVLPNYVETSSSAGCSFRVLCGFTTSDTQVLDGPYPYIVVMTADGTDSTVVLLSDARLSCKADKWYNNGLEVLYASCYGILQ